MPLPLLSGILSLLAFVCFVNAQGSYVINDISLPGGSTATAAQGDSVSSGVNFTEPVGFDDSVSRHFQTHLVLVVDFLQATYR